MSAPRPHQFIALRRLAAGSRQCRQLHMTGSTYLSPLLTTERPGSDLPRDIAGLRAECKRRNIDFSGSYQELMSRLSADDLTHSRAFSTAMEMVKRPMVEKTEEKKVVRHFNTSRTLKAVNDSSTIDFAYLPDFDPDNVEASAVRVPLLPTNFFPARTGAHAHEGPEASVMKAEISTMSADSSVSHMSEVHDNNAMQIDFHAVADKIATASKKIQAPVEESTGILRTLWAGIVEDFRGPAHKPSA